MTPPRDTVLQQLRLFSAASGGQQLAMRTVRHLNPLLPILLWLHKAQRSSSECNLTDSHNHLCLHTFLERDFPLIEEMTHKPNFIREGREFEEMCDPVDQLVGCYEELLDDCPVRSYFRERTSFIRVMFAVRAMRDVLCSNKSIGLQEITRQSTCIESARRYGYCDDYLGMSVLIFFSKMLRFEMSDSACQHLSDFKRCLIVNARQGDCQELGMSYVTRSLDEWIRHYCERAGIFCCSSGLCLRIGIENMQPASDSLFNPFLFKPKFKSRSVLRDILKSQVDGQRSVTLSRIPSRRVHLSDIVPTADVISHVFLGFTQNGQHLISYTIDRDVMTMHIWLFRMREKLALVTSQPIFRWSEGIEDSTIQRDYYDSTALSVYQWPNDDQHLLVFVVPDHPVPAVITVTAIFFDQQTAYILEPGSVSYSVVGWGQRDHCTFHTGSEIVALSISRSSSSPDGGRDRLVSRVLDVECHLGDLIEGGPPEDYVRLLTYELFVFAISSDDTKNSLEVDSFVHAVVQDRSDRKQSFREFTLKWNVVANTYQVNQSSEHEKENQQNPSDQLSKESPMVPIVFREMVSAYNQHRIHCLDNQQLVDVQLSLETMSSPTDSTVIELNALSQSSRPDD